MRAPDALFSSLVAAMLFLAACATPVSPTVTMNRGPSLSADSMIYLSVRVERERIAQSLQDAGFTTTARLADAQYTLEVTAGRSRRGTSCGHVRNVSYILTDRAQRVMAIKGRGLTGSCVPNIFDAMSRELASQTGIGG